MAKKPSVEVDKIEDEPGAEERFLRGVQKAVNTPPKPFTPKQKGSSGAKGQKSKDS
jgi:hypothetical protein